MNTQALIIALYHAETALAAAFRSRAWDSEKYAAKVLLHRVRNLRAALASENARREADLIAA